MLHILIKNHGRYLKKKTLRTGKIWKWLARASRDKKRSKSWNSNEKPRKLLQDSCEFHDPFQFAFNKPSCSAARLFNVRDVMLQVGQQLLELQPRNDRTFSIYPWCEHIKLYHDSIQFKQYHQYSLFVNLRDSIHIWSQEAVKIVW